ncbi:NUDIX domain-containing protein [Acetobacteraceae bacterium KSS8]|uniref:GDP-mannose pyrophosphatase n=1 Tax=Endosaccharibacter trunci TaxID=2812733 RepID=A0ABT1W3V1_9PROT|nr:NUDIX domain-containing protein [Acetobacteraceae bacterium KSS8]
MRLLFPEVEITGRTLLSDAFRKLERIEFRQKDGKEQVLQREVYHNGPGAAVLPFDPTRGTVLLVRQLRIAAHLNGDPAYMTELCAGLVDEGDAPERTVEKEALQELGYRLHAIEPAFVLYMNPGSTTEKLHLFTARYEAADHVASGGGLDEEGERIRILEPTLDEAITMIRDGIITDAKTIVLLQHAALNQSGAAGQQG